MATHRVNPAAVSSGRMAQMSSPFRPFSRDERDKLEEQMQTTYDLFLSRVAQGRKTDAAKIDAIAQGRVWTGRQAHQLGLVDELGGLDLALKRAGERARLDPAGRIDLVVYPPARTLYDVAERKKRYDAAQKILQDELPIVYLYNQTVFFALRSNLQGFVINPDGMIRLSGLKRS